jgi:hypothetical protein
MEGHIGYVFGMTPEKFINHIRKSMKNKIMSEKGGQTPNLRVSHDFIFTNLLQDSSN